MPRYHKFDCFLSTHLKLELADSLKLQLSEVRLLPLFTLEKIQSALSDKLCIFLGTSCSGKTTLAKHIFKVYPGVVVLEHDERLRLLTLEFLKKQARESFDQLFSIFGASMLHYITCPEDDLFWKRNLTQLSPIMKHVIHLRKLCEKHFKELHEKTYFSLFEDCKFFACLGFFIIVHVVGKGGLSRFIPFTSNIVLSYCPPDRLASRVILRNQRALNENQPLEMRCISVVLEQFSKLFSAEGKIKAGMALDEIETQKFINVVQYHHRCPFFAHRPLDIKKYTSGLLQNLQIKSEGTSKLYPGLNELSNASILIYRSSKKTKKLGYSYK